MIVFSFTIAATTLIAAAVVLDITGRIGRQSFFLVCGIGLTVNLVTSVIHSDTVAASFNAVALVIAVWAWWRGGGGDDTKRRLREWGRKFVGVRRTAPVGAS